MVWNAREKGFVQARENANVEGIWTQRLLAKQQNKFAMADGAHGQNGPSV